MQLSLFPENNKTDAKTVELPIPKTLNILGKKFKLVLIQEGDESSVVDDCDGLTELSKQTITMRLHAEAEDYDRDTMFHEVIHATEQILFLRMKENQVHQLASGLLAVFSQNPELATWLFK